jgi:hypothetical protein
MKILKILGTVLAGLVLLAGVAWLLRSNPLGPISGRAVTGSEVPYPADWGFTDEHFTIAVEVRPDDPHSVTVICFVHQGDLYVPAQDGSSKNWPKYALEDPRVRVKVGDQVFAARAIRVTDMEIESLLASAAKKYDRLAEQDDLPEDLWLFQIAQREG